MTSLIRAFIRDATTLSGRSIFQAKVFSWSSSLGSATRSRTEIKTYDMLQNVICKQNCNYVFVSFECWDGGKVINVEKRFPFQTSARGKRMLPFSDRTVEEIIVKDIPSFEAPIADKIQHRSLYLTTGNDSQFWEDFCFVYQVSFLKMLQNNDLNSFVKPEHARK